MSPNRNEATGHVHNPKGPAYLQLYEQFRDAILNGQLHAGARLPASRRLAAEIGVSRNTVLAAFEQLDAEGYLDKRQGSGTYVADTIAAQTYTAIHAPGILAADPVTARGLSERGTRIADLTRMPLPSLTGIPAKTTAFQIGLPALSDFPFDLWARLYSARLRRPSADLMRYSDPAGYRPLREAIASHIAVSRGIRCTAQQVVIVSGSQQALEFSARMLLDPGDPAWIEDPCYLGTKAALVSSGAQLVAVPVDEKGIDVAAGIDSQPAAKLAFVTPSHQFPLGTTMALERRLALIDWAAHSGAWVIEDDYDNEFHYQGRPLAALQAIDPHGRVIYIGTFSKVMYPGLRLGYIIAPPELVDGFIAAHLSTDMHSHLFDQAVLADFMEAGHFTRHLRRMRLLYHNRQRLLLDEAQQLGKKMRVNPTPNGLHLVAWLPAGTDELNLAQQAAHHNLHLWPLSQHCINRSLPPALLLGYAGSEDTHIRHGMRILRDLLN